MRLLLLPAFLPLAFAQDLGDLSRKILEAETANLPTSRLYYGRTRVETRHLDAAGKLKSSESKTFDSELAGNVPFRRLIEKNDAPLSPAEEQEQREQIRKLAQKRASETPAERAQRLKEETENLDKERQFISEIGAAFDFRLVREEQLNGRNMLVIDAKPKPGFQPRTDRGRILPKIEARLWIDRQTSLWMHVEADVLDTISFGLFMARFYKGTRIFIDREPAEGGGVLMTQQRIRLNGRIALVKSLEMEMVTTRSNFRRIPAAGASVAGRND